MAQIISAMRRVVTNINRTHNIIFTIIIFILVLPINIMPVFADLANPTPISHSEAVAHQDYESSNSVCNAATQGIPLTSGWEPTWQYVQPDTSNVPLDPNTGMPRTRILRGRVAGALTKSVKDDNGAVHFYDDIGAIVEPDFWTNYIMSNFNSIVGEPYNSQEMGRVEVEWEKGSLPIWAWPFADDYVVYEGKWIWDCAHKGDNGGYRSEIHPPREIIDYRGVCRDGQNCLDTEDHPTGGSTWVFGGALGNTPLPATVANVFISSNGGQTPIYTDCPPGGLSKEVFQCSHWPDSLRARVDGNKGGLNLNAENTKKRFQVPTWYQRVNDEDFEFDIYPPEIDSALKPHARLIWNMTKRLRPPDYEIFPCINCNFYTYYTYYTGAVYYDDYTGRTYKNSADELKPIVQALPADNPDHIHVKVPFTTVDSYENHINDPNPPDPATWDKWLQVFGYTFAVSWDIVSQSPSREFVVKLEKMKVFDDMDSTDDAEWNMRVGFNGYWQIDPYAEEPDQHHELVHPIDDGCIDSPCNGAVIDLGPLGKIEDKPKEYPLLFGWRYSVPSTDPIRIYYWARDIDPTFNDFAGDRLLRLYPPSYQGYGGNKPLDGTLSDWVPADNGQFFNPAGDPDELRGDRCPKFLEGLPSCYAISYSITETTPTQPSVTLAIGSPTYKGILGTYITSNTSLTVQSTTVIKGWGRIWKSDTPISDWTSDWIEPQYLSGIDGRHVLQFQGVDSGNGWPSPTQNGWASPTQEQTLFLDTHPPTTSLTPTGTQGNNSWFRSNVTVAFSATDPLLGDGSQGSGVAQTTLSFDSGLTWTSYNNPLSLVTEGIQIILYHSVDNISNQETAQNATFKIDRTQPTVNITGASDGTFLYTSDELLGGIFTNANSFSVSYVANDTVSGIYQVRLDSTVANTTSGTLSIPLPPSISTHTLIVEDMAGNPSSSVNFSVVSIPPGTFTGGVAPQDGGLWKNAVKTGKYTSAEITTLLQQVNLASRAFGVPINRYNDATLSNYIDYLTLAPAPTPDDKVRRELLTAWLNLISGREPAAQAINVDVVPGWSSVVKNTGSSNTTVLNLMREVERRLAESPSATLLITIKDLLEKLNDGTLNTKT